MATAAQNEVWLLRYATEDIQVRIDANRDSLVRASWFLAWRRRIALLAVLLGFLVFSALSLPVVASFFGMEHSAQAEGAAAVQAGCSVEKDAWRNRVGWLIRLTRLIAH